MESWNLEYALALAESRGCIAALAEQSPFELSVVYERLLLLLDAIHGDEVPALEPVRGDPGDLWVRLVAALDGLFVLRRGLSEPDETIESWCDND